jgi:hypothetical protein
VKDKKQKGVKKKEEEEELDGTTRYLVYRRPSMLAATIFIRLCYIEEEAFSFLPASTAVNRPVVKS